MTRRDNQREDTLQLTTSAASNGQTQKDEGPVGGELTTFEAPADSTTPQTQTAGTTLAQGNRHGPEGARITLSLGPPSINDHPVSSTVSDANTAPLPATISFIAFTADGVLDNASRNLRPTTMSTSTTSSIESGFPGTVLPDPDTSSIIRSSSTILLLTLRSSASPIFSSSKTITSDVIPLPTSTPLSNNNGTIPGVVSEGRPHTANIAYAAIALALFVVLVLAAFLVRREQKRRRALEAVANPRSEGVFDGDGKRGMAMGTVPIIAVPVPPLGKGRIRSNTMGQAKGVEMHPLQSSPSTPGGVLDRARTEGERELRDSDIYSPRYGTPSNHTSASSTTQRREETKRIGILPSAPSIELADPDGHAISASPQTPPPTLPPLPSPDINSDWLPSNLNSPVRPSTARSLLGDRSVLASPPSPPVTGPNNKHLITDTSSRNGESIAPPFHRNYKRISDAPVSRTGTLNVKLRHCSDAGS